MDIKDPIRGLLVRAVIELEYAQAKMGNDRDLTRGLTIAEARRALGWHVNRSTMGDT